VVRREGIEPSTY